MQTSRHEIQRLIQTHAKVALQYANSLSTIQRIYALVFLAFVLVFTFLFIFYHSVIFSIIEAWKSDLVDSNWKWLILVGVIAATSFPPLIGYSSSITLTGYVFGFTKGWGIAVLGSVVGATIAFVIYRQFLSNYAKRMSSSNQHFMALTAALDGKEGLTLLTMIRFCPFPFSLANAALSTIPSITYPRFMFATTVSTLRLMIYAFVGSRLAGLAEDPETDKKSKIVNWVGITGGLFLGILTGVIVYRRTKVIANRLAAERDAAEGGQRRTEFVDDVFSEDDFDVDLEDASRERNSLLK